MKDRTPGYYLDVGACHPTADSVTKLFSLHGWTGINIEPQPHLARLLEEDRPNDVNLVAGVGDTPGELELHVVEADCQRTTFSSALAEIYRAEGRAVTTHRVPVVTLDQVLADHPMPRIDFLKIDAEGFEDRVLAGLDLTRHRPSVIVAEFGGAVEYHYPEVLDAAGYLPVMFDGVNRYFVAQEAAEELSGALSYPACALDEWIPAALAHERAARAEAEAAGARALDQLNVVAAEMEMLRSSESWRVGQAIARCSAPLVRVWHRLRGS
ncbi:MAG: FkbM family methyltransferase [Ilumatobacteraceae bacterium]